MDANEFNIDEMVRQLKLRNKTKGTTALFLGAKAGGLFRSLQVSSTLGPVGLSDFSLLSPLERYHRCYRILSGPGFSSLDVHDVLTEKVLLQEIKAEEPELCVAELTKRGFFSPVLSVS